MRSSVSRRFLFRSAMATAAAAPLVAPFDRAFAGTPKLNYGEARPFSYDALVERARHMAGQRYEPPYRPAPDVVQRIDYADHGQIHFKRDQALFADGPGVYPVTFFHLGKFFSKRVKMFEIASGEAREILYTPDNFDMPANSVARLLPSDSGFAGFRFHESRARDDWRTQDWVAFLGASYFRSIGALNQYGISARGLAVDVAAPTPEEFPDFTEFYISPAAAEGEAMTIHALLDGPGVTGAYRFSIRRTEGCVMDIESRIFTRRAIHRLGIAPLTSMFWYGEYNRPARIDWRPEIHDSDGLALWTGGGERIWRPLNNPQRIVTSSFVDENPRGFGFLQRDRNGENYLDGVNYERRPSLWVEPIGAWGRGSVQLVEIPTDDEIHDNIVAFWRPEQPIEPGMSFEFKYRLHWLADEPYPPGRLARVFATRVGRGGEPGRPRPPRLSKYVVDFAGPALEELPRGVKPECVISCSRGHVSHVFSESVPGTRRWRGHFDFESDGRDPSEIRLYLRLDGETLTETWLHQHHPIPAV